MKKSIIRGMLITFLAILVLVSCNLLPGGLGKAKVLSVDDAKVEIRAANQEIIAQKDVMLDAPGMYSLSFMLELLTGTELKSAIKSSPIYSRKMTYSKALGYFNNNRVLKSATVDEDDDMYYGILDYDFEYESFQLVAESNDMMQMNYPADETALANQQNNAQLTITNLEFDEISSYLEEEYNYETDEWEMVETTEPIPVSADVILTVDGAEVLNADYSASYNSEGMPLSMSAEMESGEYSFSMSHSGSSTSYNSKLKYKLGNDDLMAYDIDVVYAANMEDVESVEGYYLIAPLKFEGSINSGALNVYEGTGTEADLTYMNSQIDVDVIQSDQNAKIGILQFQMYYDYDFGYSYPMMAIVYDDGTYEWLDEVLTVMDFEL